MYGKNDSFAFFILRILFIDSNIYLTVSVIQRLLVKPLGLIVQLYIALIFSQKFVNWYQEYCSKVAKYENVIHRSKIWINVKKTFLDLIMMLIIS